MNNDKDVVVFAETTFRNEKKSFGIKRDDRRRHFYVIGKTGAGKTVMLENMVIQDIQAGRGVGIIDPHGEFVERMLDFIPLNRVKDVIYFNPADTEYPIGFNILGIFDPKYKHLVASGLIGVFTKIWANVWSPRMEYILSNCILALLDTPGTTLLGILRILVDKDYRQKIINNLKDPVVKSFWVNEYTAWSDNYRNEAIAPIQNKVGQFLNVSLIRNIVGQPKSTINVSEIMNEQKIFLVNVSTGNIGEDNAALLGAMVITKIQLAAMERIRIPEETRKDFYLYVDEFQNFVTESFANILSEARKYRLNLIISHQYINQLVKGGSTEVRDAVFGNVGSLIAFRVGAFDAKFLEDEFEPEFTPQDLVSLSNFNIYLKLMIDGVSSRPFSAQTFPPQKKSLKSYKEKIIKFSREKYTNSKEEVENQIAYLSGSMAEPTKTAAVPALHNAICSLCNKKTKLTFAPISGRPVYCKSCFKKQRITNKDDFEKNLEQKTSEIFIKESEKKQEVPLPIPLEEALEKDPQTFHKKRKEINLEELRKILKQESLGKMKNKQSEEKK